jgi:hypothetical protein
MDMTRWVVTQYYHNLIRNGVPVDEAFDLAARLFDTAQV